jgi:hypothetical protein
MMPRITFRCCADLAIRMAAIVGWDENSAKAVTGMFSGSQSPTSVGQNALSGITGDRLDDLVTNPQTDATVPD